MDPNLEGEVSLCGRRVCTGPERVQVRPQINTKDKSLTFILDSRCKLNEVGADLSLQRGMPRHELGDGGLESQSKEERRNDA